MQSHGAEYHFTESGILILGGGLFFSFTYNHPLYSVQKAILGIFYTPRESCLKKEFNLELADIDNSPLASLQVYLIIRFYIYSKLIKLHLT